MAKVAEDAALELPLNDEWNQPETGKIYPGGNEFKESIPAKKGRHITIALNHLSKQRSKLMAHIAKLKTELDEIDEAMAALE